MNKKIITQFDTCAYTTTYGSMVKTRAYPSGNSGTISNHM